MPKGSSICTPISSTPSRRKAISTAAGTITQWHALQRVKGRKASQMTRNLDVCLQLRHHKHTHMQHVISSLWGHTVATAWQIPMLLFFWGTDGLAVVSTARRRVAHRQRNRQRISSIKRATNSPTLHGKGHEKGRGRFGGGEKEGQRDTCKLMGKVETKRA